MHSKISNVVIYIWLCLWNYLYIFVDYLSTLCGNGLSVYAMQVAKAPDGNGGVYAGIILVLIV